MKKAANPNRRTRNQSAGDSQLQFARSVLSAEAHAIHQIHVGASFDHAVDIILTATGFPPAGAKKSKAYSPATGGSVVVSGMGKSGLIGQKVSATLASTGSPSHFLHPTEALHGDLGRVRATDAVLLLSYTGNTDEIVALAAILKQDRVPVIAIVGKPDCDLARLATATLPVGDVAEACPHNLAPTASTTAMLALGDALALAVSRRRNFGVAEFKKVHPGGALGRLLLPITDVMRLRAGENLPLVPKGLSVAQALAHAESFSSSGRRVGAILIVSPQGKLDGIFTDGDLRRLVVKSGHAALKLPIEKVMASHPRRLLDSARVRDAVRIAREFRFDEIPVVDKLGKPVGLIDVQDLVALKVIET